MSYSKYISGLKTKSIIKTNIIFFLVVLFTVASAQNTKEKPLTHIVVCWLNDAMSDQQIDELIGEIENLKSIPGILELNAGRSIESERAIVDDSFTISITMKFQNSADMKAYLSHPDHIKFVDTKLKPNLTKIIVYDFEN